MKKIFLTVLISLPIASAWCCTNLLVGKSASTDGSTMVSYSADSYALFGELYHWPAASHPEGTLLNVYEWDTGKFLGQIPQVKQTYNVIGNMNEHQLCIGETTFTGREELADSTGIMDYGSLIYITLQRAKTAREAISIMTDLVEKYGYYSTGESFSIVDKNEVWIMEMIGKGPGRKGAVWVAVRIPDDCISAHANQARIQQFPLNDKENCVYSKDVISFAREKGYFSGADKDFSFTKAYAPYDFMALRICEARVWSFFNKFYKNAEKWIDFAKGDNPDNIMPLYIKPDRKLSVQDIMAAMRDHYEGTYFDMTVDIGAGSFYSPMRFAPLIWKVDSVEYINERPIATQQTGFTFVGQMRNSLPDEVGALLWFGVDDATFTVYTPMYANMTQTPECFRVGNGDLYTFSWTSSFWIHNWVANMAYPRYSQMAPEIVAVQSELENGFFKMQLLIERKAYELLMEERMFPMTHKGQTISFLTNYSIKEAQNAFSTWKGLGERMLIKYTDGIVRKEENGQFKRNEHGNPISPTRPGYNERHYRMIVKDTGDKLKVREF
ncbi:MAG: C69 family dipeptidase [Dysgonamonadaceae bacterium]|jgi:dipeptidase|nr:C69 family dipeptidase [Dysgonamonadaceae bacterium]